MQCFNMYIYIYNSSILVWKEGMKVDHDAFNRTGTVVLNTDQALRQTRDLESYLEKSEQQGCWIPRI